MKTTRYVKSCGLCGTTEWTTAFLVEFSDGSEGVMHLCANCMEKEVEELRKLERENPA